MNRGRVWITVTLLGSVGLIPRCHAPLGARSADGLRIAAANVNFHNERAADATRSIVATQPDLAIILEWTGRNLDRSVLRESGFAFILDDSRPGTHGMALLARKDLRIEGALVPSPHLGPCAMPMVTARSRLGDTPFGVIGVHAPPPVPDCRGTNSDWIKAMAKRFGSGRALSDMGVIKARDPVAIVGDLNAFPSAGVLGHLRRAGFEDVLDDGLFRIEPTWSPFTRGPRLIRLDYALLGAGSYRRQAAVLEIPGSDHSAVVLDVQWSRNP